MKTISIEESIEIKKSILKEFDKYCKANGIKYSLAYGTLLGAIREKGMIPWDDDIDVAVSRTDFDKLEKMWMNPQECRYRFLTHRTNETILTKIGYFYDSNTISIYGDVKKEDLCIHIDVYPVETITISAVRNPVFRIRRFFYHLVSRFHSVHPELRHGIKRIVMRVGKTVFSCFNEGKALNRLNDLCKNITNKNLVNNKSKEKYSSVLIETGKIHVLPHDLFGSLELYEYEREEYPCFSMYDQCLKKWYGDYMTPPPQSERQRPRDNGVVKFYWK